MGQGKPSINPMPNEKPTIGSAQSGTKEVKNIMFFKDGTYKYEIDGKQYIHWKGNSIPEVTDLSYNFNFLSYSDAYSILSFAKILLYPGGALSTGLITTGSAIVSVAEDGIEEGSAKFVGGQTVGKSLGRGNQAAENFFGSVTSKILGVAADYLKSHPEVEKKFKSTFVEKMNYPGQEYVGSQWDPNYRFNTTETVTGEIVGQGGGGSSPGSEMTEDQYSEYLKDYFHDPEDPNETYYRNKLKEDPSVNRMHYDPSQMTEGQQAEYLNDYFHDPSMTEDQEYERLKEFFDATYDSREDISNAIGSIGQNMKGAFTPDADFKIGIEQNVLSSADFYDPVTEMVNYDPTKRVLNRNGIPMPDKTSTSGTDALPAATARPFAREAVYRTPNSENIKQVLYTGVVIASQYAKGYLYDRARDLAFGKKLSKKVKKVGRYYSEARPILHAVWGKTYTIAPSRWQAFKNEIGVIYNAAKWISSRSPVRAVASVAALAAKTAANAVVAAAKAAVSIIGTIIRFLFSW